MTEPTKIIEGGVETFSEIASQYDLALCDIWGVLHNGREAYRPAAAALEAFRRSGKAVVLITNAPRPNRDIREQLRHFGVPDAAWNSIVTSGDVSVGLIRDRGPSPVYYLGPPRDMGLFDIAAEAMEGRPRPSTLEDAEYVLCTGLFDDARETPADYEETLQTMAKRGLTMICANPDLVVHRGAELIYCAGALAERYEAIGGKAIYAGKPHAPIYEEALARGGEALGRPVARNRVVAIGDAMRTDIAGAAAQGIDALFITAGIHRDDLHRPGEAAHAAIETFWTRHGLRPRYYAAALRP